MEMGRSVGHEPAKVFCRLPARAAFLNGAPGDDSANHSGAMTAAPEGRYGLVKWARLTLPPGSARRCGA